MVIAVYFVRFCYFVRKVWCVRRLRYKGYLVRAMVCKASVELCVRCVCVSYERSDIEKKSTEYLCRSVSRLNFSTIQLGEHTVQLLNYTHQGIRFNFPLP
jgi:hypothetical protein